MKQKYYAIQSTGNPDKFFKPYFIHEDEAIEKAKLMLNTGTCKGVKVFETNSAEDAIELKMKKTNKLIWEQHA